ncbi:MAG: hypothetical protein CHACPFDD_03571 [Phycisphaerae bacterium]|nr:hypothetical protein [Phycisphaerae bacterium]
MFDERRRLVWQHWYRRAAPAYFVFLCCVTHFPKLSLDLGVRESDKIAHLVAFGVLAFMGWRFWETFGPIRQSRPFWMLLVGLSAYAALDEYLQSFVGRSADVGDWLFDVSGIVVVLAGLEVIRRKSRTPRASAASGP